MLLLLPRVWPEETDAAADVLYTHARELNEIVSILVSIDSKT